MQDLEDDNNRLYLMDWNRINIKFQLLHADAKQPTKAHDTDAGYDLYLPKDFIVEDGDITKLPLGLAIQLPKGYELQIRPRSSASKKGLHVSFGTVDSGYRGEIALIVCNLSGQSINLKVGDRIAQAIIAPVYTAAWTKVDSLEDSARGHGGFGSTGQ